MTSSVTSFNGPIAFEPIDPQVLKNCLVQINAMVADIGAAFARLDYLPAVNDHARTLQKSINEGEKWRADLALLGQTIHQANSRLEDSQSALIASPEETDALNEEIRTAIEQLITAAKSQHELQKQRLRAIEQPLPEVQSATGELTALASGVEARCAEMAPKLSAAENDLKTVSDALQVISEMKLTDIAEKSLKSVADTIALKGLEDPAAIVAKAGDLLKRTLGTLDESLTYLSLVDNQTRFQKLLNALRADDDRWALELVGMKARLDYLATVGTLDKQRTAYAEHFSRLPSALGQFVDHLQQPDANLASRLARLRVVCAAFQVFIKPR
jgi:DNA repair exonuclease SbcCD ATPase subunit